MVQKDLYTEYHDWMCQLVCGEQYARNLSFRKLLHYLHERVFTYTIEMDDNRAADGTDLRYRFGREMGYGDPIIAAYLDIRPCSVLEMMVALSIRCEEHIMEDSDFGDRTGQWFWNMIVSLGLGTMTDVRFDLAYVEEVIDRFLDRDYEPNGKGGLFTVENSKRDLRNIEIWYQMCMYLDTIL